MGWQQRDGARPERWRWRDFERERESGWGREACTALSQETVLYLVSAAVAMTTTMAAAVTALSPRSPLLSVPSHPSFPLSFPPPLLRSVSFSSPPSRRLLHSRLIPASSPSSSPSSFSRSSTASGGKNIQMKRWQLSFTFTVDVCECVRVCYYRTQN